MKIYRKVVRILFGLAFLAGGVVHLIAGRIAPDSYAAYGETAVFAWLADLWSAFVMPNITWLTIAFGVFEMAIGICLLAGGRAQRGAVAIVLVFFAFLVLLGYSWPTASLWEDFLKNRAFNFVMAAMIFPLLVKVTPRNGIFCRALVKEKFDCRPII